MVAPLPHVDENIALARFANLLSHYTGQPRFKDTAAHALKFLAVPAVATEVLVNDGILLADRELREDPTHLTVIGAHDGPAAAALFAAALKTPAGYLRAEWWDRRQGPLPNPDVLYPELPRASAFVCAERRCSRPVFEPAAIARVLASFGGQ